MSDKQQFGEWQVIDTIKKDRCFIVEGKNDPQNYVLKKGRGIDKEIKALRKLNHPNVLNMIDYSLNNDDPYHVTEFCEIGRDSFLRLINDPRSVNLFLQRVFRGCAYCWSKGIALPNFEVFLKNDDIENPHPVIGDIEGWQGIRSIKQFDRIFKGWEKKKNLIVNSTILCRRATLEQIQPSSNDKSAPSRLAQ